MKEPGHILIVDDDEDILVAGKLLLKRQFSQIDICNRPEQIPKLIAENQYDAVLLDMNFGPGESSGDQGFYWLKEIISIKPDAIVVMITAHGSLDLAIEAMKQGATDFVAKPWQNEKLIATVSTAVELGRTRGEANTLKATNQTLVAASNAQGQQQMIGQSAAMQQVYSLIERAAPTEANVLVLGENGTGKELAARAIHQQSLRHDQLFMSVDLGSVAESLFESELFGHEKGAFTGANQQRIGKLQAADGGTLFLDEIGNLPLHLQAKLLTVLEQRKVTPLGANKAIDINVRVIAATNLSKTQLQDESHFRQDLLFRLNTVEVTLPPLRERQEDIIPIVEFYLALYSKKYHKEGMMLSPECHPILKSYPWVGNVRALRHAVERAVILADNTNLMPHDFQLAAVNQNTVPDSNEAIDISQHIPPAQYNLEQVEKQTIAAALKEHKYNISHSAKALGLTRAALYRRMEKHGL